MNILEDKSYCEEMTEISQQWSGLSRDCYEVKPCIGLFEVNFFLEIQTADKFDPYKNQS